MSGEKERKKGGVSGEGVAKERERSVIEQRERESEECDWGEKERRRRVSGEKERRNVIGEREGEC